MYFAYGEEETDYLKKKDKRMAEAIKKPHRKWHK